jgi:hypothetical protein
MIFGNKEGTGVGLDTTLWVEKKEGIGVKATCRLDDKGDAWSGEEGFWSVDPGVVLARGCCSVLIDVRVDWCFLEAGRCGIDYGIKDVGTFDVFDVNADVFRIVAGDSNLTDFKIQAEMSLLDTRVESLDELVKPITDTIMTKVAWPLDDGTAETVERVYRSVEGLVVSTDTE